MIADHKYQHSFCQYTIFTCQDSILRSVSKTASSYEQQLDAVARAKDFNIKKKAYEYIVGSSKEGIQEIQYLIREGLVNIVIPARMTKQKDWSYLYSVLTKNGFTCAEKNNSFLVFVVEDACEGDSRDGNVDATESTKSL